MLSYGAHARYKPEKIVCQRCVCNEYLLYNQDATNTPIFPPASSRLVPRIRGWIQPTRKTPPDLDSFSGDRVAIPGWVGAQIAWLY